MADKLPNGIKYVHVVAAIQKIEKGIPNNFSESIDYDVLFNNKRYAPKAVIGVAASILTGDEFYPKDFKGGLGSKCFKILSDNGFSVVRKSQELYYPDEIQDNYKEGKTIQINVNRFERNLSARDHCIKTYGAVCQVCEFDFQKNYGVIGQNFIHVHHIVPLSSVGEEYVVDPVKDLIPVCPNCHAMIHKKNPPFTVEELKYILAENLKLSCISLD